MSQYCFILNWDRPLYLWSTLDSLFHYTKKPLKYVLVDNNSTDPLVHQVIKGFERRGMFEDVLLFSENYPHRMQMVIEKYKEKLDNFFYFCENDVIVPQNICWATNYEDIYKEFPKTGMIGSTCDVMDFPDVDRVMALHPELEGRQRIFYTKENVPERFVELDTSRPAVKASLENPPGRLILYDTEALLRVGYNTDHVIATKMTEIGYDWLITTAFRHRHIALEQVYDYPPQADEAYQTTRDAYFRRMSPVSLGRRLRDRAVSLRRRLVG